MNYQQQQIDAPSLNGLDYIKGSGVNIGEKPCVVELWATWCPPCRDSIPHLTQLAHKYDKVAFLGITQESRAQAQPFVTGMGDQMDYSVACDPTGGVVGKYSQIGNVRGIPHAFVVNASGKIIWSGHPMDNGFESALQQAAKTAAKPEIPRDREVLMKLSARDLKRLIAEHNIAAPVGLLEKKEFVDCILNSLQ